MIAGYALWLVLALLDQRLPVDSEVVEVEDATGDAEASVHGHYLPCAMDWHSHLVHESVGLGVLPPCVDILALELGWECPLLRCILWTILSLLQLNSPDDGLAIITISNGMILITKRVGLTGDRHEARTVLVEEGVN